MTDEQQKRRTELLTQKYLGCNRLTKEEESELAKLQMLAYVETHERLKLQNDLLRKMLEEPK